MTGCQLYVYPTNHLWILMHCFFFHPQNISVVTESIQIICPPKEAFLEIEYVICDFQTCLCTRIIS